MGFAKEQYNLQTKEEMGKNLRFTPVPKRRIVTGAS